MGKTLYTVNAGERYGLLTTVEKISGRYEKWVCSCDCGGTITTVKSRLRYGTTISCGCERKRRVSEINSSHGMSDTKEYRAWRAIQNRCYNTNDDTYKDYGARGIQVSQAWRDSFEQFMSDMGESPQDGKRWSIGRIDNDQNYCKENCKWETDAQQARNKGKLVTNTSGVTGVTARLRNGRESFAATWLDLSGTKHTREFSANKYGRGAALQLATAAREDAIKKLNEQGAGYSAKHGK